jgi:hypothetical protein
MQSAGLGLAMNTDHFSEGSQMRSGHMTDGNVRITDSMVEDEMGTLDQIFDHLDPQQWLTPSAVSWGHWYLPSASAQGC